MTAFDVVTTITNLVIAAATLGVAAAALWVACRTMRQQAQPLTWHHGWMAQRWQASGGWTVTVVHLTGTSDRTDGERLRVCHYGWWTADVRTVAELERFFDLADLQPELSAPPTVHAWARSRRTRSPVSGTRSSGVLILAAGLSGPGGIDTAASSRAPGPVPMGARSHSGLGWLSRP
jgi:hypothetical protein